MPRSRHVAARSRDRDPPSPQRSPASRTRSGVGQLAAALRAVARLGPSRCQPATSANSSVREAVGGKSGHGSVIAPRRASTTNFRSAVSERAHKPAPSAAASLEYSRRNAQIAPSTTNIARRPTSRSTTSAPAQRESPVPRAAAAPRVSGRRQVSSSDAAQAAMNTPSRSRAQGMIAETTVANIEPARPRRARDTSTNSVEPSASALARNSTRGRPAARLRSAAAATTNDTAMTRGSTGASALPRATRPTTAAASARTTSQQRRRQIGAATANQLAQHQIQGLPASSSAASPTTMAAEPNIGAENQLARHATVGPAGRGRQGTRRQGTRREGNTRQSENVGEASRADVSSIAGSSSNGAARSRQSPTGEAAPRTPGRQRGGPSRQQFAAQIGDDAAMAEAIADPGDNGDANRVGDSSSDAVVDGAVGTGPASNATGDLARSPAALPTRVAAPAGTGGLAAVPASSAGVPDRRASPRSRVAHEAPSRFLRRSAGSRPSGQLAELDGPARRAAAPFAGRVARRRSQDPAATAANPTGVSVGTDRIHHRTRFGIPGFSTTRRWALVLPRRS